LKIIYQGVFIMKKTMLKLMVKVANVLRSEKGQGMVEYGLIIGLIAVILIGALTALSGGLEGIFGEITGKLESVAPTSGS